ncbi:hypothetical protein DFH09DRAFT_450680 [Mycena vulgaris]|nr:hypothetical protein DFH09DRAFT_450680 [Mycena vulgaris]
MECKDSWDTYEPRLTFEEGEQFWTDSQPLLLARGYQLRPRYRPNWIPSWTLKASFKQQYEDNLTFGLKYLILDATRIRDGKKVVLKRVPTQGKELAILKHLTGPSMRSDPRNRTIPLLDIIPLPDAPWSLLAMEYCRTFNYPPFHCRNEFLEAMSQFLEVWYIYLEVPVAYFCNSCTSTILFTSISLLRI